MRRAIAAFTQGAPASDDVTMLAVTLTGIAAENQEAPQMAPPPS